MQPSFEYSIDAMVRALTQTVQPAVNPEDKAAAEQLAIVIGSLGMLRSQIDHAHWFEHTELADMAALAEELAAALAVELPELRSCAAAHAAAAEARALAMRHDVTLSTLREASRGLRALVTDLISQGATASAALGERIERIVLDRSKRQIGRERAYVAGAGFDVFPDNLVPLEQSLTAP